VDSDRVKPSYLRRVSVGIERHAFRFLIGTGVSEEREFSILRVEVGCYIPVYATVHGVTSQNTGRYENLPPYLLERHILCSLLSCLLFVLAIMIAVG
jgi:hypothetical protein